MMRAVIVLALILLGLRVPAANAGGEGPGEPDLAAIARLAKRVDPGQSYLAGLPARRRECRRAAAPYAEAGTPELGAWGERILIECYAAMLEELAIRYHPPDAFGPGGMRALLRRLRDELALLYAGIYQGRAACDEICDAADTVRALSAQRAVLEAAAGTMAGLNVAYHEEDQWDDAWNRAGRE
jgi:hypothetical protein